MRLFTFFIISIFFTTTLSAQNMRDLHFGTDTTLEVCTWNIEHFPKDGQTTINYVMQIVESMDIDILALQEIEDESAFNQLDEDLADWDGYYADYSYSGMAYLYKADLITMNDIYKILTTHERPLPRAPLVMECSAGNHSYVLINNHFKCCGDGEMDESDEWDEETRRYDASVLLKDYIDANFANDRVILLGDLNDVLTDNADDNVFQPFITDENNYEFADMSIAESDEENWSYPSWPSHLDHLLVTDEIFTEYNTGSADVETIKPDEYLGGGWDTYETHISDHRPVALRLHLELDTSGIGQNFRKQIFDVYPNPVKHKARIVIKRPAPELKQIGIYNASGKLVDRIKLAQNSRHTTWHVDSLKEGVYFFHLDAEHYQYCRQVVVVR